MIMLKKPHFLLIILIYAFILISYGIKSIEKRLRVMVVPLVGLEQGSGGNNHVYITIKALIQLNYKVIMWLNYFHEGPMLDLVDMGVEIKYGPPILLQIELIQYHYTTIIEFVWNNVEYFHFLRAINIIIKDISSSTSILILNPDILHLRLQREHNTVNVKCKQCNNYKEIEIYLWENADVVIGINEEMNKVTKELAPNSTVVLLPYAQSEIVTDDIPWENRNSVIYFGTNILANVLSAKWLVTYLVPELYRIYNVPLHIYGNVNVPTTCMSTNGCIHHKFQSNQVLYQAISESRWMLAPVFTDVGVSTKILKSLAIGTPVITTPLGLGGFINITNIDALPLIFANNMSEYLNLTIKAYGDKSLWKSKHKISKTFVDEYFGFTRLKREMVALFQLSNSLISRQYNSTVTISSTQFMNSDLTKANRLLTVVWEVLEQDSSSLAAIYKLFPYLTRHFHLIIIHNSKEYTELNNGAVDVYIRLQHYTEFTRPICCPKHTCTFITYLYWDFGSISSRWVKNIEKYVDIVWTPSQYHSSIFQQSGLSSLKLRTLPYGITCLQPPLVSQNLVNLRELLNISKTTFIYGYIGEFAAEHSIDILTFALSDIKLQDIDAVLLTVIGRNASIYITGKIVRSIFLNEFQLHPQYILPCMNVLIYPVGSEWSMSILHALVATTPLIVAEGILNKEYFLYETPAYIVPSFLTKCSTHQCNRKFVCLNPLSCERLNKHPTQLRSKAHHLVKKLKRVTTHPYPKSVLKSNVVRKFVCEQYGWENLSRLFVAEIYFAREYKKMVYEPVVNKWKIEGNLPNFLL